tara:strand:- start:322 stop:1257 length:936 start_codon:yes stop_codon:yes gene_type:complete
MIIKDDDDGQRLDRFLKKAFPSVTFGQSQKLIRTGQIRINGKRAKADSRLSAGDDLRLPPSLQDGNPEKNDKQFSVKDHALIESLRLFEDADILVLNKPAGLAVQGGSKTKRHIDGLLNSYQKKGVKPRLVHRLDKDTSGILVLAKTADAARELTHAFQGHDVQKTYWAITAPAPLQENGTIDAAIGKSSVRQDGGEIMIHDPENGKKAITDFEILDRAGKQAALVAFYPKTGRTHQIRVHAALIGAPLLGDRKYNPQPFPFENDKIYNGLHLHAHALEFPHPKTRISIRIEAPLSKNFLETMEELGFISR